MDVGCVPDLLPGYQQMDESPGQHAIQTVWGQRVPREPGLGLREVLAAARDGTVKSMLLLGDSIDYSSGELGDGYAALQKLEFLVVHDAFLGSAAQLADVVLPATTFAEEDGTYTNLERRVQLLKRVITPKNSEAWPAWRLLSTLAHLMNAPGFEYSNPSEVFDEIAQVTSIYAGVSHGRLVRGGSGYSATGPRQSTADPDAVFGPGLSRAPVALPGPRRPWHTRAVRERIS